MANDKVAWKTLVGKYERLVYSIPLKEGLSAEDADELTQDVFVALVHKLPHIREPEQLAFWLMTTTRRMTWRYKIRRARENKASDCLSLETAVDDCSDRSAESAWIYEILQSMGEPCRTLIRDLYLNPREPSYAEVAIVLGRPLGSIGPMRARCLERFRTLLEDSLRDI